MAKLTALGAGMTIELQGERECSEVLVLTCSGRPAAFPLRLREQKGAAAAARNFLRRTKKWFKASRHNLADADIRSFCNVYKMLQSTQR